MVNRNDVQKAVSGLTAGGINADEAMEVIDDYAKKRTAAQEIAQTIQVLGFFALLGWVAWLIVTG